MDVTTLLLALLTALLAGSAGLVVGLALGRGGGIRAAAERDALRDERDGLRADRAAADERARRAEAEAAATAAALDAERAGEVRLREAFRALSADALAHNNEAFVQLAEGRLKAAQTAAGGDLAQRQQAIEGLVAPLRETLGKVETQIREVERGREGAYASLLQQVATMRQTSEQLRTETAQLVTALRAPQVRGRWGEMQLRRVVESAGMVEHCDFTEQVTSAAHRRGRRRPAGHGGAPGRRQAGRGGREGRLLRLPGGVRGPGRGDPAGPAQGARAAPARARRLAGGEGVLGALRPHARVRRLLRAGGRLPGRRAAAGAGRCWSTPSAATW